jgi:hypothetical protein
MILHPRCPRVVVIRPQPQHIGAAHRWMRPEVANRRKGMGGPAAVRPACGPYRRRSRHECAIGRIVGEHGATLTR